MFVLTSFVTVSAYSLFVMAISGEWGVFFTNSDVFAEVVMGFAVGIFFGYVFEYWHVIKFGKTMFSRPIPTVIICVLGAGGYTAIEFLFPQDFAMLPLLAEALGSPSNLVLGTILDLTATLFSLVALSFCHNFCLNQFVKPLLPETVG